VQVTAARALVDAGADLVIGHHPHVLQGIEAHGRGVIAYSLGNFLFENTNDPPRWTGVLRTRIKRGGCFEKVTFHPAYLKRTPVPHPVPATGYQGKRVIERMTSLSRNFGATWDPEGDDLVLRDPPCSGAAPAAKAEPTSDPAP
jgi:poly-gamma-glutamate synthesis protein (capsule biosynthesis protein)